MKQLRIVLKPNQTPTSEGVTQIVSLAVSYGWRQLSTVVHMGQAAIIIFSPNKNADIGELAGELAKLTKYIDGVHFSMKEPSGETSGTTVVDRMPLASFSG